MLGSPTVIPVNLEPSIQSSVSVTCSPSGFVVRVNPAFYGLGADDQELTLGRNCRSNGVLRPQGDLLFTYALTACDGVQELPPGYLVYKYVLHYEPSPKRFPSRAHQMDVNIECHYPRDHSVYLLAIQPTWQTVILLKKLKGRSMEFQINIMDDSWKTAEQSQVYLLGQIVNIQVSAPHLPPGLKLYINSCYAAPSSGSRFSLKYTFIDNFGCMLDSRFEPGSSRFISRTDTTLRFSLRTFQFTADPDTKVSIHCKLSVTSEGPGPAHKSCTYQDHRWRALTGQDSICECCESTCRRSEPQTALLEGFAISRPLVVSDQPHTSESGSQKKSQSAVGRTREDGVLLYKDLNDNQQICEDVVFEKDDDYDDEEDENDNERLEESETIHGSITKPELELAHSSRVLEDQWMESSLSNLKEFTEGVTAYGDVLLENKEKGGASKDEIPKELTIPEHHKKDDLPHPRGQLEDGFAGVGLEGRLKPHHPKEEKIKKPGCREGGDWRMKSKMQGQNEQEETWYFTWS
ncbi:PREDICTED: zona pellucida sperm-binding protein 3-like [Cyprinodon variegatus]|uniref:zona pellucida sperm-binding protein 3-like n=1 Tax=Cyprinodon variegatus TaxID=28743 RepID=UPI0007429BA9|nr:PREDICTED: zona pellucida sperm-binding protein 3-like [Cyprinodon variegatus]